jgi:hypothetical protein
MKRKIRRGVFETNSSSTHSITISEGVLNDEMLDTIIPNEDGVITLTGGEFGWEVEEYNDALTKANYCAIDNAYDEEKMEMLNQVIEEQTGARLVVHEFDDNWGSPNWSYIDHQSRGTSDEAFESKEVLRQFIFNKNSILYTDNDNRW